MADVCIPISELSSYVQNWTICARVTNKSPLRVFSRGGGGSGKVFHVSLLDAHGGEIRGSFWNDAAELWHEKLAVGRCYRLARGGVKVADARYNPTGHRYELAFDKSTEVELVDDDEKIEAVKLQPVDLASLKERGLPALVDVCGVVTAFRQAYAFTSKEGKELVKRDVTLADDSLHSITVSIWGDRAKQEDKVFEGNPVVAMKGVMVKEWNGGRSGSLSEGGALVMGPTLAAAERLRGWWAAGGQAQPVTALSAVAGAGAGGGAGRSATAVDLAEVRRRTGGVLAEPEMYSVVCRLSMVQTQKRGEPQPLSYMACQEPMAGRGLPCNRRVDASGYCGPCGKVVKSAARFNLRCRFADAEDGAWLTTFHEAAEQVLGMSAEKASGLEASEGGREALETAVAMAYFDRPLQLTLRAKMETYNGEVRTSVSCIDAKPVGRGERGRALLREIGYAIADS